MELEKIKIEERNLEVIIFNKNNLLKKAKKAVDFYNLASNVVYPDKPKQNMKNDRANINGHIKDMKDKFRDLKKEQLKPLEPVKEVIDKIINDLQEPLLKIKGRIEDIEGVEQKEKKAQLLFYYGKNIGDISEILTFDKMFNDRWLNSTFLIKDIKKDILDKIIQVNNDLQVIKELQSEFEVQITDKYLNNFILAEAFQEKTRLEELKKKVEVKEEKTEVVGNNTINKETGEIIEDKAEPKLASFLLEIITTVEKKNELKKYLENNNIKFNAK